MKLIVGLGNIGKEYEDTRHNIGFKILDEYFYKNNITNLKDGFKGQYIKQNNVIFLKPSTYMNLSGESIQQVAAYFKIKTNDIYVIYDDMDLEFLRIRIRDNGSSAGHNGIKSIIKHIGTNFIRIRVGIDKDKEKNTIGHVLGKFSNEQLLQISEKKDVFIDLINDIIKDISIDRLKNKYNNK